MYARVNARTHKREVKQLVTKTDCNLIQLLLDENSSGKHHCKIEVLRWAIEHIMHTIQRCQIVLCCWTAV